MYDQMLVVLVVLKVLTAVVVVRFDDVTGGLVLGLDAHHLEGGDSRRPRRSVLTDGHSVTKATSGQQSITMVTVHNHNYDKHRP